MKMPILSDNVVTLRAGQTGDIDVVTRACQDESTARWLASLPYPYRREDAEEFLTVLMPAWWAGDESWAWLIADAGDDVSVGSVGFHDIRRDEGIAEIGYWVAPWARRRGYATVAVRLACRWALQQQGLARIEWYAYVGNDASWRVAEKVGFTREGTLRSRIVHRADGSRRDAWLASLLAGELR